MEHLNDDAGAQPASPSPSSEGALRLVAAARPAASSPKHPHPAPSEVNVQLKVKYALNKLPAFDPAGQIKQWDEVRLRSYNGGLVGPVIEARPGDTLNLLLENQLPPEPPDFNVTNLHLHGLHVSPAGNSDNVMLEVIPGQQFQYEIKIPRDHPAGTYWYHAHKHGSVGIQISSGMAGALIIRGDIDEVPAIKRAREKIFVMQQIPYVLNAQTKRGEVEPTDQVNGKSVFFPGIWEYMEANLGRRFLINGEAQPTLELKPGEVQRWRFIHAGFRQRLGLQLVQRDPRTGAEVAVPQYLIALDGITTGSLDAVRQTDLHPGYRADVLVRATDAHGKTLAPGVYWLVDTTQDAKARSRDLARVVVRGKPVRMKLPTAAELARLVPFHDIQDCELTGTQKIEFELRIGPPLVGLVNGKPYDPNAPPRKLTLGAAEEWHVSVPTRPGDTVEGHPFHIHTNPFQCKLKLQGLGGEREKRVWKDTIFVDSGATALLRTRYRRYIGTFMLHCHVLAHEDLGMMEAEELVLPGDGLGMSMGLPGAPLPFARSPS